MTSPHGNRAVSLQERQAEMLREKIKALEHRLMDMMRHGNENVVIADRLHRWARKLFEVQSERALPAIIATEIRSQFIVPQVAIKVWDVDGSYATEAFARRERRREDLRFVARPRPYCGVKLGLRSRPTGWDDTAMAILSP